MKVCGIMKVTQIRVKLFALHRVITMGKDEKTVFNYQRPDRDDKKRVHTAEM